MYIQIHTQTSMSLNSFYFICFNNIESFFLKKQMMNAIIKNVPLCISSKLVLEYMYLY